jgi:NAD(P)H dehydrogenase (quinone)
MLWSEPKSFKGALTRAATEALTAAGHEVVVSDLHAMGFNPVSDRRNFTNVHDPDYYRQQAEEADAAAVDGFAPDLEVEMDKLFWYDALILQFPLWWFGLPAILKGWIDRVIASGGRIYGAVNGTTVASSSGSGRCAPSPSAACRQSIPSAD